MSRTLYMDSASIGSLHLQSPYTRWVQACAKVIYAGRSTKRETPRLPGPTLHHPYIHAPVDRSIYLQAAASNQCNQQEVNGNVLASFAQLSLLSRMQMQSSFLPRNASYWRGRRQWASLSQWSWNSGCDILLAADGWGIGRSSLSRRPCMYEVIIIDRTLWSLNCTHPRKETGTMISVLHDWSNHRQGVDGTGRASTRARCIKCVPQNFMPSRRLSSRRRLTVKWNTPLRR
jgi:hypothetical protein